ncbi:hypothetical protein D3C73_1574950 [compost metagenome]
MNTQPIQTVKPESLIPGETYLINYGTFSKVSTFLHSSDGINSFFDINGRFNFSDSFINSGGVTFELISNDDDFYEDDTMF